MTARIKLRRDTAANWTSNNPILALGEPGFETDTNKLKIGDGVTVWASLGYTSGGGSLSIERVTQRLYDTLQSGMPSWLTTNDRGVWTEGVNWGFDGNGLWFQGDLSDNNFPGGMGPDPQPSFPVFTNFVVPYNTDVTVGFDFTPEVFVNGDGNWSDHGICAYVDGTDPIWNWGGQTDNIVVARFDSDVLELNGVPGSTTDTIIPGTIVAGTEYRMMFTYNSRTTGCIVEVYKAADWYATNGNTMPIIVLGIGNNNLLGENSIRIGFAADPDVPGDKSYYKNLSIEFQDNNDVSGLPLTLDATFTPDGQLKLPGDMILGNVKDDDYVLWAPKNAEYAGLWWGGDREQNGNGYGPDGSITVGNDSNDDGNANDNASGVRVALTAKAKTWTFDEVGSMAGPDGTVTVKGNIAVGGTPLGWIVTEGDVPNQNNDLWFDHVLKDTSGNVYAIGGTWNNQRRVQFNKYDSTGAVVFQKEFQIVLGADSDVTSAELSADEANITAVMRYYDPSANNGQGYWFGGIVVIDTANGDILSFDRVTNNANQDFELLDLDFMSNGNLVYVGQASPNPIEYTVTTADAKPGSTTNVLRVDPTLFNGALARSYSWKVGGTGLTGERIITGVDERFNYPSYTTSASLSGPGFSVLANISEWPFGYYVDTYNAANGSSATVGEIITFAGTQLGGVDGGRITPSTTYIPISDGEGTWYFDKTTYPTMDQDVINGSFVRFLGGPAYGVTTMLWDQGSSWGVNITVKAGTAPTGSGYGEVRFYAGNDCTVEITNKGFGNWFALGNVDGCPQLDYIQITIDAQGYDFSSSDATWTIYNYTNANALLKTPTWERTYGSSNNTEVWRHVIVDSNDNVFVATQVPTSGRWTFTKFNFEGAEQWTREIFEENNWLYVGGLTVDQNDNLIVTGRDDNNKGVVMKVDTDGNVVWYWYTDTSNFNNWSWNNDLTAVVDDGNNILMSASLNIYNSGPYNTTGYDLFIAHINGSDGSTIWSRFLGTENDDYDSYDWEGYHLTSRGDTFNVVLNFSPYNNNATVAQLPLDGTGIGEHGIYSYRDAGIVTIQSSAGYNTVDIGITSSDVVVRTTQSVDIDTPTDIVNDLTLVTSTDGGGVSGVRTLEFDDGSVMTTAAKGPDSTWTNSNGNQWRIETYNGGFNGYYDGSNPLEWWNASYSPSGNNNFRGAIIEYHAFVGNGTIIGTIHIANDYSQYGEVTHTENISGNQGTNGWIFWYGGNGDNNRLYVKHVNGYDNDIAVQWTARMFYGSDYNC